MARTGQTRRFCRSRLNMSVNTVSRYGGAYGEMFSVTMTSTFVHPHGDDDYVDDNDDDNEDDDGNDYGYGYDYVGNKSPCCSRHIRRARRPVRIPRGAFLGALGSIGGRHQVMSVRLGGEYFLHLVLTAARLPGL